MKQTKTTLKALTAAYRAVLRHGILCNAIALGLIATAPAMAERTPASERLVIASGQTEEPENISWSGFSGSSFGGAVDNSGTLTATGVAFENNSATSLGGAIDNYSGNVTINGGSLFSLNSAVSGGAIDTDGGSLTINSGSVFDSNSATNGGAVMMQGGAIVNIAGASFEGNEATFGGALYDNGAIATVTGVENVDTFKQNSAENGGAIFIATTGNTTVNDATFKSNTATDKAGAVYNKGILNVTNSNFGGNTSNSLAGAIYNIGTLSVTGSTFDGNNSAQGGAIIDNTESTGGMTIISSTFKNNTATVGSGAIGIFSGNGTTIDDVNFISNSAGEGGALFVGSEATANIINGSVFDSNTATTVGGAISTRSVDAGNNVDAKLDIVGATFKGNSAGTTGGAIDNNFYNSVGHAGSVYVSGTTFGGTGTGEGNSAANGGAIYNHKNATQTGNMYITDTTFAGNSATAKGGAVYNEGIMTLSNATFGGAEGGNSAEKGGAIYNNGTLTMTDATLDSNFSTTGHGGAVYNEGTLNITDVTMNLNRSADGKSGGAIYNNTDGVVVISGGAITNNVSGNNAGAIYSASNGNVTIDGTLLQGNTATENGGAIYNNTGTLSITDGTLIDNHTNGKGAGIYNKSGMVTLTDTVIQNNVVDTVLGAENTVRGGAGIYNLKGLVTINATNEDITFSGNRIDIGNYSFDSDIYNGNSGTLTLNAAANRTLTLDGGIDGGGAGTMYVNTGATNTGVVKIAGTLNGQNVTVAHGELHLIDDDPTLYPVENAYLAGSTINVAGGAIINTIDDAIQDLSSIVTLADGALVAGDIDYTAGLADTYSADNGATITYTLANALNLSGIQYGVAKEIQVTNAGATINKGAGFAWFDSDHGLTLESGGAGTGTILVAGTSGGINAAVDATNETAQEITYTASAASETFDGADNVIQNANFAVTGNGNETTSNTIVFANDMIVDGQSTLSLQDINLENTDDEAITVQQGGAMYLTDARVGVDLNILGTLVSDPTYYDARVVNSGTASFTGDVFESGSSLTNSAIVDLNNVEFKSDSSLIGNAGNTLNLVGTGNIFNGSSTGNNVVLASGANYTGTLYDGVVDARNGGIDTITGSVSGGDLYVDANLTSGEVDTFGGTSGATIKGIKLANAGYGTEDKVELTIGEATLANDLNIDGMNYYTSVVKDGDNIVFSDKLINESNLYSKLGSWTGTYVKSNADMTNAADGENYMTVGQALVALDTQITTLNGDETTNGSVAKTVADAFTAAVADGGVVDSAIDSKIDTLDLANTYDAKGAADTALVDAKAYVDGKGYQTATDVNGAINDAIDTLDLANTYDAKGAADTALADAKAYVDGKGYQTATDVDGAINDAIDTLDLANTYDAKGAADTALADAKAYVDAKGYQTATDVSGAIDDAIDDAFVAAVADGGIVDSAIDDKIDALDLANTYDAKGAADTALADAKAYVDAKGYQTATDVSGAIDDAIDDAFAAAVADGGIVDSAIDDKIDALDLANTYDAKGAADTALADAKDYVDAKGYQTSDDVTGAINTALADYTTTDGIADVVNDAVTAAFGDSGAVADAVNAAVSNATTMADDGDDSTSMYNNFADGADVVTAVTALDNAAQTNADAIAAIEDGTTVVAKAAADGNGNNIAETYATNSALNLLGGTVDTNTADIATIMGDESTNGSIKQAAANAVAQANAYTDSQLTLVRDSAVAASNAYTDRRIEDLDKNLSAGVAGAVALSSVAVSGVERGEVSVGAGYGYFNGQSAAAFGATMGLSNRWSVNAGAGISNADVSFRAGTNYKFKLF